MDNMRIGALGIFNRINNRKKNDKENIADSFSTNPFGISFKGKVHSGDLFQSSSANGRFEILQRGKMVASAVVASLVEFKNTFVAKIQPIIDFAKQTSGHVKKLASTISEFKVENIRLGALLNKDKPHAALSREARKLLSEPVESLAEMWERRLATA